MGKKSVTFICAAAVCCMLGGCWLLDNPDSLNAQTLLFVSVTHGGTADECTVQIGPDFSVEDPDLAPYLDCTITVNDVPVPYLLTGSSYVFYKYTGALGLTTGSEPVVVIESPNLDRIELSGAIPPEITGQNIGGADVTQYLAGALTDITVYWTAVGCDTCLSSIELYNSLGNQYGGRGRYVTGTSNTFDQSYLTFEGVKATDIILTVQGANGYDVEGCLPDSQMWTKSAKLEVASTF